MEILKYSWSFEKPCIIAQNVLFLFVVHLNQNCPIELEKDEKGIH